jgi:hypothetical protein
VLEGSSLALPEAAHQGSSSKWRAAGRGTTGASAGPTAVTVSHCSSHERVKPIGSRSPASHSICARKLKGASARAFDASGPWMTSASITISAG